MSTLRNELEAVEVPYEHSGGQQYIDTDDGRFAYELMRVAVRHEDYIALRALVSLKSGIGAGTCSSIASKVLSTPALNFGDLFFGIVPDGLLKGREVTGIEAVRELIALIDGWGPNDSLYARLEDFRSILEERRGTEAAEVFIEIVEELPDGTTLGEAKHYISLDTNRKKLDHLERIHNRLELEAPTAEGMRDAIPIMSMHGAKGLDADIVFIPGLEEELIIGDWRAPYPAKIDEAARMLYVSITRARVACFLSFVEWRQMHGSNSHQTPCRFASNLGGRFEEREESLGLEQSDLDRILTDYSNVQ